MEASVDEDAAALTLTAWAAEEVLVLNAELDAAAALEREDVKTCDEV